MPVLKTVRCRLSFSRCELQSERQKLSQITEFTQTSVAYVPDVEAIISDRNPLAAKIL